MVHSGYTLREIQARVGGELVGDPQTPLVGVNALELAEPGQLTFAESDKYAAQVRRTRASAVIVPQTFPAIESDAHISEGVSMSGQVGLAGSVRDRVVFGGQAGVADHITIGDDARIGAGSGVIKDVRAGETVWWFPARPIKRVKEELATLALVPKRIKKELGRSPRRSRRASRS